MARLTPIAHWKLNDNAPSSTVLDAMGSYNGTYKAAAAQNTSTGATTGVVNGALTLDGVNEHIQISDAAVFTPALTPFSISAWINQVDATTFTIAGKYDTAATTREWLFYTDESDRLTFRIYDETNDKHITRLYNSALTTYQNTWLHVVGTYDGGTTDTSIKLYLNGSRVDNASGGSPTFVSCRNTAVDVEIGVADGTYASGLVDNIIFFDVELTASEVGRLYNGSHGTEIPHEWDEPRINRGFNRARFTR